MKVKMTLETYQIKTHLCSQEPSPDLKNLEDKTSDLVRLHPP